MTASRWLFATVVISLVSIGCGASVPTRFVLERDIGDYRYRRYQHVLDVEVPVQGNDASGHTATYLHSARGHGLTVTTAFVTVYRRAASLAAELSDALHTLGTYDVAIAEVSGDYVWKVEGGQETWLVWVSGQYIVKLGAPHGSDVPEDIADTYLGIYPSDLDEHGRARDGRPSAGASRHQREEQQHELDLPDNLREGAPR